MTRRALHLLPAVGAAAAAAATVLAGTAAPATSATLQRFDSCRDLTSYARKNALPLVGPYGLGGGLFPPGIAVGAERLDSAPASAAAPAAGVDYSATNVQEAGVDEPDLVKTDGTTVFAIAGTRLEAVELDSGRPVLAGSLTLPQGWSHELLRVGSRLLVLSRGSVPIEGGPVPLPAQGMTARMAVMPYAREQTRITQVDASNPRRLAIVATMTVDGGYVSAREVDGSVRVVIRSAMPAAIAFVAPATGDETTTAQALDANRTIVAEAKATAWLPRVRVANRRTGKRTTHALVQCRNVYRPASFSGLGTLTVLTIDLDRGLDPVNSDALLTDASVVYASPTGLYVATQRWDGRPVPGAPGPVVEGTTTEIHAFDIAERDRTSYRASGKVAGVLLSQWSLSEAAGVLRVASTDTPSWWTPPEGRESESFVTTLRPVGTTLAQVGRVGGLGKGERIYAVRFLGNLGYVVTFRQVDPLYTVDLSDPANPRVRGELKVEGFSSYLHPVDEDLLLGVGQDATTEGRVLGSQISLFDVSDPARPDRLGHTPIGPGHSEVEYDHHAFLYWGPARTVVLPVQTYSVTDGQTAFGGVVAYRVGRAGGIEALGRITHPPVGAAGAAEPGPAVPGAQIRRSLVVRDLLVTVSDAGVRANALAGLADRGWAGFDR